MTEGAGERERTRYTAGEIAALVQAGRLFGLPVDTSAIHKLARLERWDYVKQKIEGQKGGAPHFYQVPARYFEASANQIVHGRRRARIKAPPRLPALNDEIRLTHLTAAETINRHLPHLSGKNRQRYLMVYLLVCHLMEKGSDEKTILEAMFSMARIEIPEPGKSASDDQA